MDASAVTQLVSNLGFPIAACCVMFWYMNKERESHTEEISGLTKVLNDNTVALQKLTDTIDKFKTGGAA